MLHSRAASFSLLNHKWVKNANIISLTPPPETWIELSKPMEKLMGVLSFTRMMVSSFYEIVVAFSRTLTDIILASRGLTQVLSLAMFINDLPKEEAGCCRCSWPLDGSVLPEKDLHRQPTFLSFLTSFILNWIAFVCECCLLHVKKLFWILSNIETTLEVRQFPKLTKATFLFIDYYVCLDVHKCTNEQSKHKWDLWILTH